MKSAVEWYYNAVNDIVIARINNKIDDELLIQNMLNAYLQAKEIEKEQIRDAFNAGDLDSDTYFIPFLKENDESENYYNKTFKSE